MPETHCKRGHLKAVNRNPRTRACRACDRVRVRLSGNDRKRLYGLSREAYAELLASQDGRCAICPQPFARTPARRPRPQHREGSRAALRLLQPRPRRRKGRRCGSCGSTMSGWTKAPDRSHAHERAYYFCYDRRTAGSCSAPAVPQTRLEDDVATVLGAVAPPAGFAEAVDTAIAAYEGARGRHDRVMSTANLDARKARLRDLYELGDISREEYLRRRAALDREATALRAANQPTLIRQRTTLRSLVDDWDAMSADQRKRLLATVFEEITVGEGGVSELVPREGWLPYLRATLIAPRVLSELKTGLYVPNVETTRLVRDDRGWLQLAV
jgi:hypothetical protein